MIDCVLWPPGLQVYEVGLLVQLAVSVTGVPGVTGAAGVAAGEALAVHTGCCASAGAQTSKAAARTNALPIRRLPAKSRAPEVVTLGGAHALQVHAAMTINHKTPAILSAGSSLLASMITSRGRLQRTRHWLHVTQSVLAWSNYFGGAGAAGGAGIGRMVAMRHPAAVFTSV